MEFVQLGYNYMVPIQEIVRIDLFWNDGEHMVEVSMKSSNSVTLTDPEQIQHLERTLGYRTNWDWMEAMQKT